MRNLDGGEEDSHGLNALVVNEVFLVKDDTNRMDEMTGINRRLKVVVSLGFDHLSTSRVGILFDIDSEPELSHQVEEAAVRITVYCSQQSGGCRKNDLLNTLEQT